MNHNQWAAVIRGIMVKHDIKPEETDGFIYDLAEHLSLVTNTDSQGRIVDHLLKKQEALRGRLAAANKQMEQMTRQWSVILSKINPETPMPWDRYQALFDLLLQHDTALRDEMGIPYIKYGMSNAVHDNPDWQMPKTWLKIIEFMDMEDE